MYSLILTVKTIEALQSNAQPLIKKYAAEVKKAAGNKQGFVIPSLLRPPPDLTLSINLDTVLDSSGEGHA
jgi:hypothetical protein